MYTITENKHKKTKIAFSRLVHCPALKHMGTIPTAPRAKTTRVELLTVGRTFLLAAE